MNTVADEVADGIYRLSTYVEPANLVFNQYLVDTEQPLLFHCGMRQLFPLVSSTLKTIIPLKRLRWISFGHFEADECGSLNEWLEVAPDATVVFGQVGCMVSFNDFSDRPPKPVADGDPVSLVTGSLSTSQRLMSPMVGTPACYSTRERAHSCVAIYLQRLAGTSQRAAQT